MDIKIYDVIVGPVITNKAYVINNKFGKLVIKVHMHANKPLVKEALEKLFEVKVDNVRILVRKPKVRSANRRKIVGKYSKRAIVTLKKGYTLDMFKQPEVMSAAEHTDKRTATAIGQEQKS